MISMYAIFLATTKTVGNNFPIKPFINQNTKKIIEIGWLLSE